MHSIMREVGQGCKSVNSLSLRTELISSVYSASIQFMKQYRFLVKENEMLLGQFDVYKCYGDDARGVFVGTICDKEILHLLIEAPATKQLLANVRKLHPELALIPRDYKHRTLRDFAAAFIGYLRKLS
jgi:hypothetical protein